MKFLFVLMIVIAWSNAFSQKNDTNKYLDSAAASGVLKDSWVKVANGNDAVYLMNLQYMDYLYKYDYNIVKVWVQTNYKSYKVKGVTYIEAMAKDLAYLDCERKRIKNSSRYVYNKKGDILDSIGESGNETWSEVVPGSVGENILLSGCALIKEKGKYK